MYMVPLEDDLFSLELPDNFMHHMLKDDDDHKVYSEEVIKRLELAYGEIDYKFAIGSISQKIVTRLEQNTLETNDISGKDIL